MENYRFSHHFIIGGLQVSPVHVRIEQHAPVFAAHRHANTSYEIHYTHRGHGLVTVDGVNYPVLPGTLYVTGRGIEHAQRCDPEDPVIEYCLYLDCRETVRRPDSPLALFVDTAFWMGEDEGAVFPLLQQMIDECHASQPDADEMLEALLRQLIVRLTRLYRQREIPTQSVRRSDAPTRAETVFTIEDAFLVNYRTLTLPQLAGLLHLSVRQTQRVLRDNFGMSFSQKLADARMGAARQFLTGTDMSITEISENTGFSSIEHFSSAFRRVMGCSPRQYRQGKAPKK